MKQVKQSKQSKQVKQVKQEMLSKAMFMLVGCIHGILVWSTYADISFKDSCLLDFIESSKTDQYRNGALVPTASSNKNTCPVRIKIFRFV